jgi:hypothetical protein
MLLAVCWTDPTDPLAVCGRRQCLEGLRSFHKLETRNARESEGERESETAGQWRGRGCISTVSWSSTAGCSAAVLNGYNAAWNSCGGLQQRSRSGAHACTFWELHSHSVQYVGAWGHMPVRSMCVMVAGCAALQHRPAQSAGRRCISCTCSVVAGR